MTHCRPSYAGLTRLARALTLGFGLALMPFGSLPETRSVRAANTVRIALQRPGNGDRLIILVVQDNLVKGAAGQAVQNMNLMFGLPETTGLNQVAILP